MTLIPWLLIAGLWLLIGLVIGVILGSGIRIADEVEQPETEPARRLDVVA